MLAVQLLSEIGYNAELYVKYFEPPLIEQCAAEAVADARLRLQTLSVTKYLAYVHTTRACCYCKVINQVTCLVYPDSVL